VVNDYYKVHPLYRVLAQVTATAAVTGGQPLYRASAQITATAAVTAKPPLHPASAQVTGAAAVTAIHKLNAPRFQNMLTAITNCYIHNQRAASPFFDFPDIKCNSSLE
jgi:hypothetical protein